MNLIIDSAKAARIPCPTSFTEDEITKARQEAEPWAEAFSDFSDLRTQIAGKDGWISHDEYKEAMRQFKAR